MATSGMSQQRPLTLLNEKTSDNSKSTEQGRKSPSRKLSHQMSQNHGWNREISLGPEALAGVPQGALRLMPLLEAYEKEQGFRCKREEFAPVAEEIINVVSPENRHGPLMWKIGLLQGKFRMCLWHLLQHWRELDGDFWTKLHKFWYSASEKSLERAQIAMKDREALGKFLTKAGKGAELHAHWNALLPRRQFIDLFIEHFDLKTVARDKKLKEMAQSWGVSPRQLRSDPDTAEKEELWDDRTLDGPYIKLPDGWHDLHPDTRKETAWKTFNERTKVHNTAFCSNYIEFVRDYTEHVFRNWVGQSIPYGELRMMFMRRNGDDPNDRMPYKWQIEVVHQAIKSVRMEHNQDQQTNFHGAKVIFCVPRMYVPTKAEAQKRAAQWRSFTEWKGKFNKEEGQDSWKGEKPSYFETGWSMEQAVEDYLELANWEKQKYGNEEGIILAGFDIVGQELFREYDNGVFRRNDEYKQQIEDLAEKAIEQDLPLGFAFHAGESGTMRDEQGRPTQACKNIIFAIELKSKYRDIPMRIAHGVGLSDPRMAPQIKALADLNIGLELCPVSNGWYDNTDSAAHWGNNFFSRIGDILTWSINSDNPGEWDTTNSLERLYFLGTQDKKDSLRSLGLLRAAGDMAINSSFASQKEKIELHKIHATQWGSLGSIPDATQQKGIRRQQKLRQAKKAATFASTSITEPA